MSNKILLIDVPNLFYRAFFAVPKTLNSPDGMPINAVFGTASALLSLFENNQPSFVFGFQDLKEATFRHIKDKAYKAQRPKMEDELVYQLPIIDQLFEAFSIPVISEAGFEADDCIATCACKFAQNADAEVNIVSSDQDLLGLVRNNVYVLRPLQGGITEKMTREKVKEKLGVFPEQVADFKAIAGDTSDNLPGIPGIGKKGAADLINEFGTLENILKNATQVAGKKGELLREHSDKALHTQSMTNLHYEVPCRAELPDGDVQNISWLQLDEFFQKYRFRLLSRRLQNMGFTPPDTAQAVKQPEKDNGEQLSIF